MKNNPMEECLRRYYSVQIGLRIDSLSDCLQVQGSLDKDISYLGIILYTVMSSMAASA